MVPFSLGGAQDPDTPNTIIAWILAGGVGLPDRDYYVKPEKRFADARAGYLVYIAKIFALSGTPVEEAKGAAQTVMRFETALAKATLDNVAMHDPHAIVHTASFDVLQKMTPHFDWILFYKSANLQPGKVNVEQPEFLAEFDRQLVSTPLADWNIYLRRQLLNSSADNLSQSFVNARFDFCQSQLAGVGKLKPRATRCAETTDAFLGEALGHEYVKRTFPPEAKQRAQAMVGNILSTMHDTIENADWMTPATKQRALEKLSTLHVKVGYPDKWTDYSSVNISRAEYFADTIAASRFLVANEFSAIGKPVDRSRWDVTPATSNARYKFLPNEITLPAGILQPPAFSLNYADAVNYGAIGFVIGHEISHAIDDQGAQFDAQGKLASLVDSRRPRQFQGPYRLSRQAIRRFHNRRAGRHAHERQTDSRRIHRRPRRPEDRLLRLQENATGYVL
jgi:putative endopeptidase